MHSRSKISSKGMNKKYKTFAHHQQSITDLILVEEVMWDDYLKKKGVRYDV